MTSGPSVRFLVPEGVDDPRLVSGGNVYDRHIRDGLRAQGWAVTTQEVADAAVAASALRDAPDGELVLVDGLVGGWAPAALEEQAPRVRLVLLAHMVVAAFPDATDAAADAERRALAVARAVVVTSRWTADELARRGLAESSRVTVAVPGVDRADAVTPRGENELLCVGVLAPHKGQDTLLDALARLPTADWTCAVVGSGSRSRTSPRPSQTVRPPSTGGSGSPASSTTRRSPRPIGAVRCSSRRPVSRAGAWRSVRRGHGDCL